MGLLRWDLPFKTDRSWNEEFTPSLLSHQQAVLSRCGFLMCSSKAFCESIVFLFSYIALVMAKCASLSSIVLGLRMRRHGSSSFGIVTWAGRSHVNVSQPSVPSEEKDAETWKGDGGLWNPACSSLVWLTLKSPVCYVFIPKLASPCRSL